jgi:hypothetical protein
MSLLEMSRQERAIIAASGHYLTEELPFNYVEWDQAKRNTYAEAFAAEAFEYWEGKYIWDEIHQLADTIVDFSNRW